MNRRPNPLPSGATATLSVLLRAIRLAKVTIFLAVFAILVSDGVLRYSGRSSISGSHEIVGILIVYVYAFGAIEIYRLRRDVSVQIAIDRLSSGQRRLQRILSSVVIVLTFALFAYYSVSKVIDGIDRYTSALNLPIALYYVPLSIAGIVIALLVLIDMSCSISNSDLPEFLKDENRREGDFK